MEKMTLAMPPEKLDKDSLVYKVNPDLSGIDWAYVCELFAKVNWRTRLAEEIEQAFRKSSWTLFVYKQEQLIAFGRTIDDGRYYAMLGDIVVDPDFQGNGLGKVLVNKLNSLLENYHFVTLTAAPGKGDFYKSLGWKKQTTAYIWPQGPKQLRQHTEEGEV
ncbi:GNAT family N-acetyltransferase [Pedobacter nutrimenti]|jgi:GNAT superfamily N-acetyltransferase|uniref:Acetyltransferase (GNAT) family protein n=1 Tax=Pedobacter nutrimenti TaxID=1241337 RepID=A0A318UJJ6_9SPHI|nr:GNAT family N-acetyltransferase [Pedobacter nutrimenti]PYF76626.1 acetyltransferase (GNAT) family protein [Pedobacter nutrimenti]